MAVNLTYLFGPPDRRPTSRMRALCAAFLALLVGGDLWAGTVAVDADGEYIVESRAVEARLADGRLFSITPEGRFTLGDYAFQLITSDAPATARWFTRAAYRILAHGRYLAVSAVAETVAANQAEYFFIADLEAKRVLLHQRSAPKRIVRMLAAAGVLVLVCREEAYATRLRDIRLIWSRALPAPLRSLTWSGSTLSLGLERGKGLEIDVMTGR